ncbi:hypothetical protein DEO72_LG3g601 [Vigna unguiculata]|uniref:Uncharacterized protein n=1 Tax=Vigna unguiculata TaxID=3917 RepID=A0A4D6LC76_VIGUN|nr:hypothetical protein DEO72_LG3g601 [Vigna unguiculata]
MTSLELWLGMADQHEESLSYGSDWRVLPHYGVWSVAVVSHVFYKLWLISVATTHHECMRYTGADDVVGDSGEA